MADEFKRERRYVVLKIADLEKYIRKESRFLVAAIGKEIERRRALDGRPPLESVVVESDWPEYEPTWAAIESRMNGAAAPQPEPSAEELRGDAELLDWLEAQVKSRGNFGVSFDYDHFVEDGYVVESGFRFMRRGYLGERHKTLRAAIAAEKREES